LRWRSDALSFLQAPENPHDSFQQKRSTLAVRQLQALRERPHISSELLEIPAWAWKADDLYFRE
jgi:hypothetical protein